MNIKAMNGLLKQKYQSQILFYRKAEKGLKTANNTTMGALLQIYIKRFWGSFIKAFLL